MQYDIFLSHACRDRERVIEAKAWLVKKKYTVFLDYDELPEINPEAVTSETAQALRTAMRECGSFLFALSANAEQSRWMPWELGYFDGFRGRVFIFPLDEGAEMYARGQEYLRIYPIVPRVAREAYLSQHVPKSAVGKQALMIDFAQQEETVGVGKVLQQGLRQGAYDPLGTFQMASEIAQAWWRLWGLLPPPRRPGIEDGKWPR